MRKVLMTVAALLVLGVLSGCCSLRTPPKGRNHNLNYYNTFFGFSLESAVYGDGLIVNPNSNE